MSLIEEFEAFKKKAEDFSEKGRELKTFLNSISGLDEEYYELMSQIEENEHTSFPDGVEDEEHWVDYMWELKCDMVSWLPSSMRC